MTTRRKFGMGIAAMLAAQRAPAALIRSLVAGRQIAATCTRLPYDANVEYLESTGLQFIDTGISCTSNSGFKIDGMMTAYTFDQSFPVMAGAQTEDWSMWVSVYEDEQTVYIGNEYDSVVKDYRSRIVAELNFMNSGRAIVDEDLSTSVECRIGEILEPYTIYGAISGGVGNYLSKARVYSMKVSLGADIVRDFIPVRFTNELGQTEGAMYDRVSGQLFRNAGTGAFVIGPVKARGESGPNGGGISG